MKNPVEEVITKIIDAVHDACETIGIKDGAIRVCIEPKSPDTAEWVHLPAFASMVDYVAPINRHTEDTLCCDDAGKVVGDAAGVTAMKIASVRQIMRSYREEDYVAQNREELTSGYIIKELVGHGMTQWKGGIAIPVGVLYGSGTCPHRGMLAMYIYVAVSGGKQDQDEQAAWAALEPVKEFIDKEDGYMLQRCLYD